MFSYRIFIQYHASISLMTDLKEKIGCLSSSMHNHFQVNQEPCTCKPDEFRKFCIISGTKTIFDNILSSVSIPRRSENRNERNKKMTVNIIYKLCIGLNQLNNFLQKDQAAYLMLKNMNLEALDLERQLGNSCSSRTSYYMNQDIDNSST